MNIKIFKFILLCITFSYLLKIVAEEDDLIPISFDFSPSWYKKLNDACMQMWGECDEYLECAPMLSTQQYDYFLDSMLGHLYFANFCMNKMQESHQEMHCEDKEYIRRTMGILNEQVKLIAPHNDKTEAINMGLRQLYDHLE